MNNIQTFKFHDREMECYVIDGQPWFRSKDAATILEYANTIKAISNNVHEDDPKTVGGIQCTPGQYQGHFHYPADYNTKQAIYIYQ